MLGDVAAVRLPADAYLVPFGPQVIGLMEPANRQLCSRWVHQATAAKATTLSPYLQHIAQFPETAGTEIILGMDLSYVLGADEFEKRLRKSKTLAGQTVDFAALSRLLASVRGVALGIRIIDQAYGKLRIDFNGDALASCRRRQAADSGSPREPRRDDRRLPGLERRSQRANRVSRRHTVDDGAAPDPQPGRSTFAANRAAGRSTESRAEPDMKTSTSLRYYKELRSLIRDVRNPDPKRIKNTGQCAVWLDRYARKIDQLPILDVDKDLLDFGQAVAAAMCGLSFAYRGVGIRAGTYSSNPNGNRGGAYYNNNGAVCYAGASNRNLDSPSGSLSNTSLSDSQIALKIGRAYATGSEFQLWAAIDDGAAALRRVLTERYRVEF